MVTATTHSCEGVMDTHYMPGNDGDSLQLFEQKQYLFMLEGIDTPSDDFYNIKTTNFQQESSGQVLNT